MIATLFAAALLLIPPANAFWRMPCAKPVLNSRVDPIISPGQPSAHSHTIMGSNAIGLSTTPDILHTDTTCSTCMVKADNSSYWTPELLYQFKNGSFQVVDHGGAIIYYLQRDGNNNKTVEAFPDGLRMFTGNSTARSDNHTPESQAISWLCLNFDEPGQPQTPGFTNTNCKNGFRGQIFFPSCWDGKNLDSPDHKSHMAYPDRIDSGDCPPTHPRRLVSLFYELWFEVAKFNALGDGGRFVLSNGDDTGFGYHGDFMNGWDRDVLKRAVDTCTNLSGVIEDCPVFKNEGRLYNDAQMNSCSAPNPLPEDDNSDVILEYLPGCVAISNSTALDQACVAANGGSAPASGVPSSAAPSSAPSSASGVPGSAPAPTSSKAPSTDAPASASTVSTPLPSGSSGPSGVSSHILLATDASSISSAPPTTASPSVASAATSAAASSPAASSPATSGSAASSPAPSGTGNNSSHCAKNNYRRDQTDAHRRSRMKRTHRSPLSK